MRGGWGGGGEDRSRQLKTQTGDVKDQTTRMYNEYFFAGSSWLRTRPCAELCSPIRVSVFTGVTLYTPPCSTWLVGWRVPASYSPSARARVRTRHVARICHPRGFCCFRFQLSSGDAKTMRRDAKAVVAWFGTGQIRLLLSSLFYVAFCSENNRRQVKNLLDVALNLTFKGLRSPSFGRVTDV